MQKNMAENILAATDGNFENEVLSEIANDYAGKIKVMKLNVDEAMNSASRYNIRGIPTILVFKDGQVVEQIVGAVAKDQITKAVDRHVG